MADGEVRKRKKGMPLLTALWSAVRGYCPNCMLGRLFKGFIKPKLGCDVCGMVYERDTSTWTGVAFFLYFALCFLVAAEGLILALTFGLFPGFTYVMIAAALLQVSFAWRPIRGVWVWWLWRVGFLP